MESQEGDSGAVPGNSLRTAQGSLVLQMDGSIRSQEKERAPAQHWSFRRRNKSYFFRHHTWALRPSGQPAAILCTGEQRHEWSQRRSRASRAEPQPPAHGWMQRHAGERSLYSSALRGSLRCWHSLTRFPGPPHPPQSLFPHHSILQLFFAGTSSCSEDYFHTQLKAKMKWCFKLSRSQLGFI